MGIGYVAGAYEGYKIQEERLRFRREARTLRKTLIEKLGEEKGKEIFKIAARPLYEQYQRTMEGLAREQSNAIYGD